MELGSGQSVASLHLAAQLDSRDTLVLTDLPNVVPLMQQSIDTWSETRGDDTCLPVAEPLGWGSSISHLEKYGPLSHIICCDLVSEVGFVGIVNAIIADHLGLFPASISATHAHPPPIDRHRSDQQRRGIRTRTHPSLCALCPLRDIHADPPDKSRTLALEQSFFDTLSLYFRVEPVVGGDTGAKIYICRRWPVTESWVLPEEKDVMNGSKEVVKGQGGYGLMEEMLGAIEWD